MSIENSNIKRWLKEAKEQGATHFLDICDTFDYEHYPVYISKEEDVNEISSKYNSKDMQQVYGTYEVASFKD